MVSITPGTKARAQAITPEHTVIAVDIGFSQHARSSGVAVREYGTIATKNVLYSAVYEMIASRLDAGDLSLILEAPLTMTFTPQGNPMGRSMENVGGQTRYWYAGLGLSVMMASLLLLERLRDTPTTQPRTVFLYEGFVSFKTGKTNHTIDAVQLIQTLLGELPGDIIDAPHMALRTSGQLRSALTFVGLRGMPSIVMPAPQGETPML